jgi:hypothetical protein
MYMNRFLVGLVTATIVFSAGVAMAYDYGWDPTKVQGGGWYMELAQDPTPIYDGIYAGKYEYFFDAYVLAGNTTYNLLIHGLDNDKIANAQQVTPDGDDFMTQEWGDPNGYENRASWANSSGRILDFWTRPSNADLVTATVTNWWRTSYDDGAGGWTDSGLGYAGSSTDNPHSYSEYVNFTGWGDQADFYMADLTGFYTENSVPWEVSGDWVNATNCPATDAIAMVGNHYGWWATGPGEGLVFTLRVVYDEIIDPATIGWGGGITSDYPILGDFTIYAAEVLGDFDNDGDVDADDIDLLMANLGGDPGEFDLTDDGVVDQDDVDEWVFNIVPIGENVGTVYGDFNLDGEVNAGDLALLATNYGLVGDWGWATGDGNGDGNVDAGDLAMLATNYGTVVHPVPEPITMSLLAVGGAALLKRRSR